MSIGEGGRLSASSSGVGSLGSCDDPTLQSSGAVKIVSGKELYRENSTARKPCEETCGYCQLECRNCSSYAALSVQRIDGKIQQVWTIVNNSSASSNYNLNERDNLVENTTLENKTTGCQNSNLNTYTTLGNVSTLCSRRAVHLAPCQDCVKYDASAPPLSRPQSSDSGLFDLSEGKPMRFDRKPSIDTITKYSYALSQAQRNIVVIPSGPSEMSETRDKSAENGARVSTEDSLDVEVSPEDKDDDSSPPQEPGESHVNELKSVSEETDDDNAKENSEEESPAEERVTNPFEEGYEDPVVETKEVPRNQDEGPNPFDEDETNPFYTKSPTASANSRSSGSNTRKKCISPSTRPSSSILDVRKLLHPDKVYPIDPDGQTKVSDSGSENNNIQYDPEALGRQPSIVSSTGPTVFSKSALFIKHMLIGAAVIIMVGVVVMFIASLGKSMMR